jgi:hypothetical protein
MWLAVTNEKDSVGQLTQTKDGSNLPPVQFSTISFQFFNERETIKIMF